MLVQQNHQWMMYTLVMLLLALTAPAWAEEFPGGVHDARGPRFEAAPSLRIAPRLRGTRRGAEARRRLHCWSEIAINTSGIGHTPLVSDENRDDLLAEDLSQIADGRAKTNGMTRGQRTAVMLARRAVDGSQHEEPRVGVDCITSDEPGKWRQDSVSQLPLALGAYWSGVTPFVLRSSDQDFPDR